MSSSKVLLVDIGLCLRKNWLLIKSVIQSLVLMSTNETKTSKNYSPSTLTIIAVDFTKRRDRHVIVLLPPTMPNIDSVKDILSALDRSKELQGLGEENVEKIKFQTFYEELRLVWESVLVSDPCQIILLTNDVPPFNVKDMRKLNVLSPTIIACFYDKSYDTNLFQSTSF